jgi:hypothetical protein
MKKYAFALIPIIIFLEVAAFSFIAELMRYPNDFAIIVGVVLICADIAANIYLINFLYNQLNKTK